MNRIIFILFFIFTIQLSISSISSAETFGPPPSNQPVVFSFDIDGNGETDALTDGLLIMRYLFGFQGSVLTNGAIGSGAKRTPSEIETYLNQGKDYLDVDENGDSDALTDGLLIIRNFFGFTGSTLINKAVSSTASRKTATAIEALIEASFINTPPSSRCTQYGFVTYTFLGGVIGTGTVSVQSYSLPDCKGNKVGSPIVDNNLTYSFANINKENGVTKADMTVVSTSNGTRTKRVSIIGGLAKYQ